MVRRSLTHLLHRTNCFVGTNDIITHIVVIDRHAHQSIVSAQCTRLHVADTFDRHLLELGGLRAQTHDAIEASTLITLQLGDDDVLVRLERTLERVVVAHGSSFRGLFAIGASTHDVRPLSTVTIFDFLYSSSNRPRRWSRSCFPMASFTVNASSSS